MRALTRQQTCTKIASRCSRTSLKRKRTYSTKDASKTPAIAFDIDGVLIRGRKIFPQAIQSLKKLDELKSKIPIAFMTNGGGMTEARKATQLSTWFGIDICPSQICLSHSPMQQLVDKYRDTRILVVGLGDLEPVARSYGFNNVVTALGYNQELPHIDPFNKYKVDVTANPTDPQQKIGAVFVMNDPEDWGNNMQIIVDVLRSRGLPGIDELSDEQHIPLYMSNPDVTWAAEFGWPRFAQGAFAVCLSALFKHMTGNDIKYTTFGKPKKVTYDHVRSILTDQAKQVGLPSVDVIYGIGDNPQADIKGANDAGDPWVSVLTRTGVFQGDNDPTNPGKYVYDDVEIAVDAILERHGLL